MAGLHIGNLPLPRRRFRLDLHIESFETRAKSRREDRIRANLLAKQTQYGSAEYRRWLRRVWRKLVANGPGTRKSTLASHAVWRRLRIRVVGHLWDLMENSGYATPKTVTIMPRGWDPTPDELMAVDLPKLMETLRADLNRCGAAKATGYLALFIHSEWVEGKQRFQLHVHGVVAGGMVGVVRRLRKRPKYKAGATRGRVTVKSRVRLSNKPLSNMPDPISYAVKGIWFWSKPFACDGKMRRCKQRSRMPEPFHSQSLLWLDRWGPKDIALLIGIRVTKKGFSLTKHKQGVQL